MRGLLGSPGDQRELELVVPVAPFEAPDGPVGFEPARVRLVFTATPGGILARATVDSQADVACSRCLTRFAETLHGELEHMFAVRSAPAPEGPPRGSHTRGKVPLEPEENDIDAGEDSPETSPIIDGHIDIRPLVADVLSLSLSMKPLCRPDCKGLCPVCGRNLNEGKCTCAVEVIDPRLAGLGSMLGPVPDSQAGEPADKLKEKDQRGRSKT